MNDKDRSQQPRSHCNNFQLQGAITAINIAVINIATDIVADIMTGICAIIPINIGTFVSDIYQIDMLFR